MTQKTKQLPVFTAWPVRPGTLNRNVYISALGYLPHKTNRVRARSTYPAVGLVVSGEGTYRVGRRAPARVTPGSLVSVYPGASFEYGPDVSWEEYYVGFAGPGVAALISGGLIPTSNTPRRIGPITSAVAAFKEIIRVWNRGRAGDADLACLLGQQLLLHMFVGSATTTRAQTDVVESVMRECRVRLHESIDFTELAERHGVSYSFLRKRILDRKGFSPAKYLTRLRCESACVLLTTTMLGIKEIARKIGINDPYTFSRTFSRTIGASPSAYRVRHVSYGAAGKGDE